jgi:phosphoglycerate kinase
MKNSITDVALMGRRVIMRVDFNVPQDKQSSQITNAARISAVLSIIKQILDQRASLALMSHLGVRMDDGWKTCREWQTGPTNNTS